MVSTVRHRGIDGRRCATVASFASTGFRFNLADAVMTTGHMALDAGIRSTMTKRDKELAAGLRTCAIILMMSLVAVLLWAGGDDAKRHAQREAEIRRQPSSNP
jgi:hypothetical protein